MRAKDLCFNCREPGHTSRNCPKRKVAKAPGAHAGTVRFADIDRLVDRKAQVEGVPVSSVRIPLADCSNGALGSWSVLRGEDAVARVRDWFLGQHNPNDASRAGISPEERFEVYQCGPDEYAAMDAVAPYHSHSLRLTELDDNLTIADVYERTLAPLRDAPFLHALREELASALERDHATDLPAHRRVRLNFVPGGYQVSDRFTGQTCFLAYSTAHPRYNTARPMSQFDHLPWLLTISVGHCRALHKAFSEALEPHIGFADGAVAVRPIQGGYSVDVSALGRYIFITTDDAEAGAYDASELVDDLLWTVQDAKENKQRIERRRRRRQRLLTGAIRVPRPCPPRQSTHPTRTTDPGIEALERNASRTVDFRRNLPKLVIVEVHINGCPARVLIDTGSMADFISTTLVDQLKLITDVLAKPLPLQLAVHGSRSKVNRSATVQFAYQDINGPRRFDVVNLQGITAKTSKKSWEVYWACFNNGHHSQNNQMAYLTQCIAI